VLCKERGWDKASDLETFLLFSEEVGELAKAIRNHKKLYIDQAKAVPAVEGELTELQAEFSDVFSYLLELANKFDVDLEDAFRKKEEKNAARVWK
jgi:NTP pyrophosphatase (non-canonical NTP hydrolase)